MDENNGFQAVPFKMKKNQSQGTEQRTVHRFHSSEKRNKFRVAEILPFVIRGEGYSDSSQSFHGTWRK
jgi:hypothetical protein